MSYLNNGSIRIIACITLVLFSIGANAQVSLIQNAIDKLAGYKNFSYQYVEKTLDYTTDTTTKKHKDIFQKAPDDKNFGYLFSLETKETGKNFHVIDLYNGQNLITIAPDDSTYDFGDVKQYAIESQTSTLPGFLKWLKKMPEKRPAEMARDTVINSAACSHSIFHTYDTIINKEHYYADVDVYIDKSSGLPCRIIIKEKMPLYGNIANYYTAYQYSDYKLDQGNVDLAAMTVPKGFHLPKDEDELPLLAPGTVAPDWTLTTSDGKQLSLAQLKDKVVLMDFFFIGCGGCMESLQSLDKIYEKYKDQNFVLVSISDRDSRKAVTGFKQKYNIKNTVCGDAADVGKAYHLPGAPLFYYIDKDGKIANATFGYDDDFESKTTALIDNLLSK